MENPTRRMEDSADDAQNCPIKRRNPREPFRFAGGMRPGRLGLYSLSSPPFRQSFAKSLGATPVPARNTRLK